MANEWEGKNENQDNILEGEHKIYNNYYNKKAFQILQIKINNLKY